MKQQLINCAVFLAVVSLAACGGGSGSGRTPPPDGTAAPPVVLDEAFPNLTFTQPVALLQHPADPKRWYVLERQGQIRTFTEGDTQSKPFLELPGVADQGEGGLLGMAFHPDDSGVFFVNYTAPGDPLTTRIARFATPDGLTALESEEILLSLDQPFSNHNGGWIGFGPDGYLYIALGDGGGAGDPEGNAQNMQNLFGSILRIDVNSADEIRRYGIPADNPFSASAACGDGEGCPELFAWGFRNPWRGSFDVATQQLWVADVGQDRWEEINLVAAGQNYGWNILEGNHCNAAACEATGLTPPVAEYDHDRGDGSITGGYVYRGATIPELADDYIYGDFVSGRIWRLVDAAAGGHRSELLIASDLRIVSFGQDAAGEIYVIDFTGGRIYRLAPP